jgi:hypothetical protein
MPGDGHGFAHVFGFGFGFAPPDEPPLDEPTDPLEPFEPVSDSSLPPAGALAVDGSSSSVPRAGGSLDVVQPPVVDSVTVLEHATLDTPASANKAHAHEEEPLPMARLLARAPPTRNRALSRSG